MANVAHLLAPCCFQRKSLPVRPQSTCSSCSARSSMLGLLKQPSGSNGLCEDPKFVKYFSVWRQDLEPSTAHLDFILQAEEFFSLPVLPPHSRSSACGTCVGPCNSSTSKGSQNDISTRPDHQPKNLSTHSFIGQRRTTKHPCI